MSRDPRHDVLFEPVRIGPKTLPNRFYQVPHCVGFGSEKSLHQARFRGMKAEGGWGAVCTEYCAISPDSDETPFISARLWDDGDVRALSLMCGEAHAHGALAGVELHHSGVHCPRRQYRLPAIAPSQLASDYLLVVPKAMEREDIRRVQADWAAAAVRAREAGFDIVYVYGAHSYLPIEIHEGLDFIRLADHLVDLWDVNVGSALEWSKDSGVSSFFQEGWQLEWTARAREATAKPIVGVGRLTSPDRMAEIVRSGVWDVIGAARPSIADPFLPRKVEEGRYDEIRRNVEVLTGSRLDAESVRTYGAEIVVVATGASWAGNGLNSATHEPIAGADPSLPHVLTPEQAMVEGKRPPGRRVVVFDGEGYFMAPGLAEQLAADGYEVELLTCLDDIAPFCHETLEQALLKRRLHAAGIRMRAGVVLESISPDRVAGRDEFEEPFALDADAVVLVTQRLSNEALYLELKAGAEALRAEGVEAVYRIGDCVAPQLIADAIFDGHRLAREIDSPNPALPLPYLRERPLAASV